MPSSGLVDLPAGAHCCLYPRPFVLSAMSQSPCFSLVELNEEIQEVDRNPISQFLVKMECELSELGPQVRGKNGENRIIERVKSGKLDFEFVQTQVARIEEKQATSGMASTIARKAKKHLESTAENVVFLRTEVESLASNLLEASEHVNTGDMDLFKETIQDVIGISQGLSKRSLMVKAELKSDEEELLGQYQNQSKKAVENARKAKNYRVGKRISAGAGLGLATAVAAYSCLSAAAASAGVPAAASGALSVTVAVAAISPVTLLLGSGATLFCGGMAWLCKNTSWLCNNAAESHSHCADVAKEMAGLTNQMVQAVEMNQSLWTGVCMAATELSGHVDVLAGLNPKRKRQMEKKTEAIAKSLQILVEALDEYLIWLSFCSYFPANYPLRTKLGDKKYDRLRAALMD